MKKLVLCTCNGTLNKTIDYARVQKEVTKIYDSIEVMDSLCLEEGLKFLSESLSSEDRLVIGACSAQIIEIPVKQKIKSDLVHFVPLREQVTWVHAEKKSATNKAVVLLSDASTRLNYLEPTTEFSENMLNRVLIIGGGIAGLRAASDLGRLGVETVLLEPKKLGQKEYLESCQYMSNIDLLENTIQKLNDSIDGLSRVYGSVSKLDGQVGSFEVMISSSGGELLSEEYGAIIIATPPEKHIPGIAKLCKYGKSDRVFLLSELMKKQKKTDMSKKTILVVADQETPLCRVEGSHLLRTISNLARSDATVLLAHSDIRTDDENLYREARNSGVIFIRGNLRKVKEAKDGLLCQIENPLESITREFKVDAIAIFPILGPSKETIQISEVLGVDFEQSRFIKTRYSKMKPVQTSRRGIFLAGAAKEPMSFSESIASAQNAALEAFKVVRTPLKRSGWIPVIDEETCDVCKACLEACPNDALRLLDDKIVHIPVHCEFCGICVSACPTRAIEFQAHSKDSWLGRLETIATTHKRLVGDTPFSLVYACSECANASIDQAGFTGMQYSPDAYVLQFPCAGMVSPIEILKGLAVGADRVIIAHCPPGGCHHQSGDHLSELVAQLTRDLLQEIGQDPDRVRATYMIAALPNKMQQEVGGPE